MRVVSLLPSATEILCAIGGGSMLVGRSHECDFPQGIGSVESLTSAATESPASAGEIHAQVSNLLSAEQPLYLLNEARLVSLCPDLILTQNLCRVCSVDLPAIEAVAARMSPSPRVLSLDPHTVEGVFDSMLAVGEGVHLQEEALAAVAQLRERMYTLSDYVNPFGDGPTVAFLEWTDPLFVAGHWTPQLIERAGGRHLLNPTVAIDGSGAAVGPIGMTERVAGKSVRVPPEVLVASGPEVLVVCPCGLSLEQTRREVDRLRGMPWWRELPAVRNGRVALVDGNHMFNRPGPRLVEAFAWLVGYLNDRPELIGKEFPWQPLSS